jgi:hypothetical protein
MTEVLIDIRCILAGLPGVGYGVVFDHEGRSHPHSAHPDGCRDSSGRPVGARTRSALRRMAWSLRGGLGLPPGVRQTVKTQFAVR